MARAGAGNRSGSNVRDVRERRLRRVWTLFGLRLAADLPAALVLFGFEPEADIRHDVLNNYEVGANWYSLEAVHEPRSEPWRDGL
jgi:hypothetical protein